MNVSLVNKLETIGKTLISVSASEMLPGQVFYYGGHPQDFWLLIGVVHTPHVLRDVRLVFMKKNQCFDWYVDSRYWLSSHDFLLLVKRNNVKLL